MTDTTTSPTPREGILEPGTPAPDFTLHSTPDQTVSLADLRAAPGVTAVENRIAVVP